MKIKYLFISLLLMLSACTNKVEQSQTVTLLKYDIIWAVYEHTTEGYGQIIDLDYPYSYNGGVYKSRLSQDTLELSLDSLGINLLVTEINNDSLELTFLSNEPLRGLQISRISEFIDIEF